LEAAYPRIEIWESWTEAPLFDGIPDALAWGHKDNHEILFWLEVDSGHSSRRVMERNYFRRLQNAYLHAKRLGIPIVFCIMGPPWVVECFSQCIPPLPPSLAVIGQDWWAFGELPVYEFQMWHSGIGKQNKYPSEKKLPFDPNQYPPKPKGEKTSKLSKPKSTKPRYAKGFDDDGNWYLSSSEREE
jgi:hypothetical protein